MLLSTEELWSHELSEPISGEGAENAPSKPPEWTFEGFDGSGSGIRSNIVSFEVSASQRDVLILTAVRSWD